MQIALVRLTALGDIIHTSASLQFMKEALPELKISWFVEEKFSQILEQNPYIDRIIPINLHQLKRDKSISTINSIYQEIKSTTPFDLVIDVQGLIKSAIVSRIASSNVAGLDFSSAKESIASLLYKNRFNINCADIAPMRFAKLIAQALNIEITTEMMSKKRPSLFFDPKKNYQELDSYFSTTSPNVVIITSASNPSKTYPPKLWIELIKSLNDMNILLVAGNKQERQEAQMIAQNSSAKLLPPMDLNQLKYLINRSDLLIGGDTGPSHIAWAMNRASILLFGSTPKSMMFETNKNIAITSDAIIKPCHFDKSDRSIATIKPQDIIPNIYRLLEY